MIKLYESYNVCTSTAASVRSDHLWMAIYLTGSYTKLRTKQTLKIKSQAVCSFSGRLVQDYQSLCIFNFLKYGAQLYQWLFFCTVDTNKSTILNKPWSQTSALIVSRESVVETFLLVAETVRTPGAGYSKCNQWGSGLFSIDTLDLDETSGDGNHAGQIHHVSWIWRLRNSVCLLHLLTELSYDSILNASSRELRLTPA